MAPSSDLDMLWPPGTVQLEGNYIPFAPLGQVYASYFHDPAKTVASNI